MYNTFLVIMFGIYKALSILGFVYLICNDHPYWGLLLLFLCSCTSLKVERIKDEVDNN
jgi:hypothetical protein